MVLALGMHLCHNQVMVAPAGTSLWDSVGMRLVGSSETLMVTGSKQWRGDEFLIWRCQLNPEYIVFHLGTVTLLGSQLQLCLKITHSDAVYVGPPKFGASL